MRLFLAVELPEELKDLLYENYKELSKLKGIKAIDPKKSHLTLAFIGETHPEKVKKFLSKFKFNSFKVSIDGYGFFPNIETPRVAWLRVKENENLHALSEKLSPLKKDSKKFIPHVAVARIKKQNKSVEKILEENKVKYEFKVTYITLFKSQLTPMGPIHTVIERYKAQDL